jgi:outer membrane protein TolC
MFRTFCFSLALCAPLYAAETTPTPSAVPSAQPTPSISMNLKDCMDAALRISPAVFAAMYDREIVRAKLGEAKAAYILPEVKLRVLGGPVPDVPEGSGPEGNFPPVETSLTDMGPFIQAKVEALQPLYTFGKLSSLKRAAEKGVEAKEAQEQAAKNEVIRQVKKVYYGIVFLRSVEEFLKEITERATSAKERVEKLLRKHSGDVTDIDLMRMEVFFAETERETLETKNGIRLAMETLGILVGGRDGPPVSPAETSIQFREVQLKSLDYYKDRAKTTRPEIRQLDDLVDIKESLMKVSKSDFFPMFFLGGFYNYGLAPGRQDVDNPFLKDDFNFNTGGVGLGFEQKLSFHLSNRRYEAAAADYKKATYDRQQALIGIELEIRKSYSDVVAKAEAVKAARNGFKAGRSWVTASTLNFGVGLVPVKDLLEAFLAYSKVKVGYFNTIQTYQSALTELSRAVGEELDG